MILTGKEDLRVIKTIESIKSSFEEMICEMDYEEMTVKELCQRARLNKKTFYHYYDSLDALLGELQMELTTAYLKRIEGLVLPDDLEQVNREFLTYSVSQGKAYEKITCSGSYNAIRIEMTEQIKAETWAKSKQFGTLDRRYQNILIRFINNSAVGIYRQWVEDGKQLSLEELIQVTNALVCRGTEGLLRRIGYLPGKES